MIPNSDRVIYGANPLDVVIVQLRFPTILRVDTELPAGFQEDIRADYPGLREGRTMNLPEGFPQELAAAVLPAIATRSAKVYEFSSGDNVWTVSLNREFVALRCRSYQHWGDFRSRLERVLTSLQSRYAPATFSRIGLRYRNIIKRHDLGLAGRSWRELLKPHIANELATEAADSVVANEHQILFSLAPEVGMVKVTHGLGSRTDGQPEPDVYIIDNDLFIEGKTEVRDAIERLNHLNRWSGRLFRWCIEDVLHGAMRPTVVQ